ncbi:hypothetical protein AGMMS49965_14390 [Bacteroidia bacterium]|nr:hypothetical protein AGMMS49965_14390 [Bacteroidia bacterium]
MAKRFVIKKKGTDKFYHLSVAKGSYIIREYSSAEQPSQEIDKGEEAGLKDVWKKYEKLTIAPYHSIEDTEFWYGILSQKDKNMLEAYNTAGTIKYPAILATVLAVLSNVNIINIESIQINVKSIEMLDFILNVFLIGVLIVFIIQLSKLIKLFILSNKIIKQ